MIACRHLDQAFLGQTLLGNTHLWTWTWAHRRSSASCQYAPYLNHHHISCETTGGSNNWCAHMCVHMWVWERKWLARRAMESSRFLISEDSSNLYDWKGSAEDGADPAISFNTPSWSPSLVTQAKPRHLSHGLSQVSCREQHLFKSVIELDIVGNIILLIHSNMWSKLLLINCHVCTCH